MDTITLINHGNIGTNMTTLKQRNQHIRRHSNLPHTQPLVLLRYLRKSRRTCLRIIQPLGRPRILPINPLQGLQEHLRVIRFQGQPESQHQIQRQIQLLCLLCTQRQNRQICRRWSLRQVQVSDQLQFQPRSLPRDHRVVRHLCPPRLLQHVIRRPDQLPNLRPTRRHLKNLRKPVSHLKNLRKPVNHLKILPPSPLSVALRLCLSTANLMEDNLSSTSFVTI